MLVVFIFHFLAGLAYGLRLLPNFTRSTNIFYFKILINSQLLIIFSIGNTIRDNIKSRFKARLSTKLKLLLVARLHECSRKWTHDRISARSNPIQYFKSPLKLVFIFRFYDGYNVSELFNTPLERETILNVQNKIDTLLPVVGVWQFMLANSAFFVL